MWYSWFLQPRNTADPCNEVSTIDACSPVPQLCSTADTCGHISQLICQSRTTADPFSQVSHLAVETMLHEWSFKPAMYHSHVAPLIFASILHSWFFSHMYSTADLSSYMHVSTVCECTQVSVFICVHMKCVYPACMIPLVMICLMFHLTVTGVEFLQIHLMRLLAGDVITDDAAWGVLLQPFPTIYRYLPQKREIPSV